MNARTTSRATDHLVRAAPLERHELPEVPRTTDGRVDVLGIARRLGGTLLESAPASPGTGRHSYVVASTAGRLHRRPGDDTTTLRLAGGDEVAVPADPFDAIDAVAAAVGCQLDDDRDREDAPLTTGLVGLLGYDLAAHVERLPHAIADDRDTAVLDMVLADAVVVVDHAVERASLRRRSLVTGRRPASVPDVVHALAQPVAPLPSPAAEQPVTSSWTRAEYVAVVEALLEHIAAGDVFQVNVGQRLTATWELGGPALYAALRDASPAPFGALHQCADGTTIASISPETFVVAHGRDVRTRPIKGTRPRGEDRPADEALRHDLLRSDKDRAENVMVVDLLRNDLGRVCVPGTVHVPELFAAEAHPTVWQLVSTVRGWLRAGTTVGDLLRATFPCGSVTGAPKVRAMELIEQHEPVRRGPWCGALGFVAPGAVSTSVTIRTAALRDGRVDYAAGGGIVADSDPHDEVEESWAKAAAFLTAVRGRREDGP